MQYELTILLLFWIPLSETCPFLCNCILSWNADHQVQNIWHCGQQQLTADKLDLITQDHNISDVDVLYLTSNKIKDFEGNKLKGFSNLKTLDLGDNQLSIIPSSICQVLPQLEALNLMNNTIESVTSDMFTDCSKIHQLKLSGNRIHVLGESIFTQTKNLQELDLSGNALHSFHSGSLNGLLKLKKIDLSQNKIEKIPDDMFSASHDVQWVDLSHNQIRSLTRKLTKHLSHVQKLYLNDNILTNMEDGVFDDMNLQVLDLSNNKIRTLESSLFGKSVVEKLLVEGNPFECSCNMKDIVFKGRVNHTKDFSSDIYTIEGSCTFSQTLLSDRSERKLTIANLTHQLNCNNDCSRNNTCQNDGQCLLEIDENVEMYSYKCHCKPRYYGTYCELKTKTSKTLLVIVVIVIIPILILIVGLFLFRRQCKKKRRQRGDMLPLTDDDFAL